MSADSPPSTARGDDSSVQDTHLRRSDAGAVAATGGLLRLQARVLGLLLALGATVLVARNLSEADFGQLALVIALITVVSGISDLGLSGVGIREWVRRKPEDRKQLLADLIGLRLITMAIGTVIGLLVVYIAGYGEQVAIGVAVAMVGVTFNAIQGALTIPLIADLRQGIVGLLELLSVGVQAVLQAVLALVGAGVVPLAAAMIPAGMAALFAVLLVLKGQAPWPRFHLGELGGLLKEAAPFAAAAAVSVVYLRSTVLIGPGFLTDDEFGSFAVAFRVIEPLAMLPAVLTGALFPILTHAALNDRARLARGYDMMWRSTASLGALAAAGLIGAAPLVSLLFTGTSNDIAIDSLVILAGALGALFVGGAGMWMLLAERHYVAVLLINLVALTTNVALTLAAGTWFGPHWFAIGILVAEIIVALSADWVARRGLRAETGAETGGRARQLVGPVLAVVAAYGVFVLVRDAFPVVPLVVCSVAAAAVLLITRSVPQELVALGREMLRRLARRAAPGVER